MCLLATAVKGADSDGHMVEGVTGACRAPTKRSPRDRPTENDRHAAVAAGRPNPLALDGPPRFALPFLSLQTEWRYRITGGSRVYGLGFRSFRINAVTSLGHQGQ